MSVRLYVGNLPFSANETDVTNLFSQAGNVLNVQLIMDKMTGRPRGFGFVEMSSAEEAQAAIAKFHGQDFNGRNLTVNEARPMDSRPPRDSRGNGHQGGFRPREEGERRERREFRYRH